MRVIKEFYITSKFLLLAVLIVLLFFFGYFFPILFFVAKVALIAFVTIILIETIILFSNKKGLYAQRVMAERLSNGDENEIKIILTNNYAISTVIKIIDELPFVFQIRDFEINSNIEKTSTKIFTYKVRPVKRGEYQFGAINAYVSVLISIVARRYKFEQNRSVTVYPSYIQMKKYQLMAVSDRLMEIGVKKIRRIGHSLEFEQIKEYVNGDDYRTINWKATARKRQLMVNHYVDERSQQVYSIVDLGRTMKMPFENMSLADYAINSSLVISNIALLKQDKAGLITFSNKVTSVLPAERNSLQMKKIVELLYNQQTDYLESDYEKIVSVIKSRIKQRSLLLFYTNFESANSLKRQLTYFKNLASSHLLIMILFKNTGLDKVLNNRPESLEEIYNKTIAEKFSFEKKIIEKELAMHGIQSILTTPQQLSVNTINKYLELKARGMI